MPLRKPISLATACLLLTLPALAPAQEFSALVSPPRFEDSAQPGTIYRNLIEITNVSDADAKFFVKTADWTLDATGSATFVDDLGPGSCRPWAGIEAREIIVKPQATKRYRFEIAVPPDAPAGECRFAIMLEGEPQRTGGALSMPIAGRIGVIVYLAIGDGAAQLQVVQSTRADGPGGVLPKLSVQNTGNAHGRLAGFIEGRDAKDQRWTLAPEGLPILPGVTRDIRLVPLGEDASAPARSIAYPISIKGRLEWGSKHLDVDTTIAQ